MMELRRHRVTGTALAADRRADFRGTQLVAVEPSTSPANGGRFLGESDVQAAWEAARLRVRPLLVCLAGHRSEVLRW